MVGYVYPTKSPIATLYGLWPDITIVFCSLVLRQRILIFLIPFDLLLLIEWCMAGLCQ